MRSVRGLIAACTAVCTAAVLLTAPAFAHERGPERGMWLLARAGGVNGAQIASAFKSDTTLKSKMGNLHSARDAMTTCLVSGADCSEQISAYTTALGGVEQEKLNVWQGLFKTAPNLKQSATVLTQMQQMRAQRRQLFQQIFAGQPNAATDTGKATNAGAEGATQ